MKLVFIIDNTRFLGGGEYAQFKFAQQLARRGHQVVIFAGDKHFLSEELSGEQNLIVRYRHTIPLFAKGVGLGLLNRFWSRVHEFFVLRPFLRSFRPDWVIGYLRESAIKAVRVGKKADVKVANFVFESPPWMKEQLGDRWDAEWSDKCFQKSWLKTKEAYASSDVLIPNSLLSGKNCKKWVAQANVSDPVYPGVEPITIKGVEKNFDIIYVGRLNALKNINDLFKAAASLKKKPSIMIVGGGEELSSLQHLSKELSLDVTFAGSVSDEKKWKLLHQSKVMVFPSSFEGFGMPPMEALMAGCQVICSDLPIFKEVYASQVHYFPLHDIKKLSSLLEKVLAGKVVKKPVPASFIKKYSWDNAAKTIEGVLGK